MSRGLKIDGTTYNVNLMGVKINGSFLRKFAKRTQGGVFKGEGIGYYENQQLVIEYLDAYKDDFIDLYEYITTMQAGDWQFDVEVFSPLGVYDFKMYPTDMSIDMKRLNSADEADSWWGALTLGFIAVEKVR